MKARMTERPKRSQGWLAIGLLALSASGALAQPFDGCPSKQISERFDDFSRTGRMPPALGRWLSDREAQYIEPFRAFDNVDYVGVCWVSAWLVRTSEGPVLIDTLHEPHVDTLIDNLRKVGVDPATVRYVLITHGHFDHAGGAYKLKPLMPKARFVMTQRGWNEAQDSARRSVQAAAPWQMIEPDLVAKDGDSFVVGDTVFRVYETPGHTFGTASYEYTVREGDRTYRAFTVGGLGLNAIENSRQVADYVASLDRVTQLLARQPDPVTTHLTTHPFSTGLFEAARRLPGRSPGSAHPLVDPAAFAAQVRQLRANGVERLEIERKAGR